MPATSPKTVSPPLPPPAQRSDRDLRRAFKDEPCAERFRPFVDRYVTFVYGIASRQLSSPAEAMEVTQAVFRALGRRVRDLPRRTVLADWLFQATRHATKKLRHYRKGTPLRNADAAFNAPLVADDAVGRRITPLLDTAVAALPTKSRVPLLLRFFLGWSVDQCSEALRIKRLRADKRISSGLRRLTRRLRRAGVRVEPGVLALALSTHACPLLLPADCAHQVQAAAEMSFWRRPKVALTRSILRAATWARWKRRLKLAAAGVGVLLLLIGAVAGSIFYLFRAGKLLPWLVEFGAHQQIKNMPELAKPVRPWPPAQAKSLPDPKALRTAGELYAATNMWLVHFRFSQEEWKAIRPSFVPPVPKLFQADGTVQLRNPKARRNGVAGAIGFDYNWTHAHLQVNGAAYPDVAVRLRGNGTYLGSLFGLKQPYKVDLNKFSKEQHLAGVHTLDFLNLIEDRSYMHDALGYELFRQAGVPAPRTAYAWLTLSVADLYERRPLGLYLLVENVDADFAEEHFGSRKTPIFKPVTTELFKDLGDDWQAYARVYDLKTKATDEQKHRVIQFARLLTHADDAEFGRRLGEFLDLDEFARYLAALVLIANYDSLLTYGQNFYMYLDPRTQRFGFIPWDMDQAWGSFPQFGTASARERASIWHPWVGRNRFLERILSTDEFRRLYARSLRELLSTAFVPELLSGRIDELVPVIRSAIAAESGFRLEQFDQAVSALWPNPREDGGEGPGRPVHQIKRFIVNRAKSVLDQLDGKTHGIILERTEVMAPR